MGERSGARFVECLRRTRKDEIYDIIPHEKRLSGAAAEIIYVYTWCCETAKVEDEAFAAINQTSVFLMPGIAHMHIVPAPRHLCQPAFLPFFYEY